MGLPREPRPEDLTYTADDELQVVLLLCEGKASTYREFLPYFFSENSLDSALFHLQEWGYIEPPEADANPAEYLDEAVVFTSAGRRIAESIQHIQEGVREVITCVLSSGETYRIVCSDQNEEDL